MEPQKDKDGNYIKTFLGVKYSVPPEDKTEYVPTIYRKTPSGNVLLLVVHNR